MTERPRLSAFYRELYELHCLFGGMTPSAANWDDCYKAASELADKYGCSDFICKAIAVTLEQIELESAAQK